MISSPVTAEYLLKRHVKLNQTNIHSGLTCDSLSNIHGILAEVESYCGQQAGNSWKDTREHFNLLSQSIKANI